jgi:hypothetical protein
MMSNVVKQYRRKPEHIEAALVSEHTVKEIAIWCGGTYGHERDRGVDSYLELIVPNVGGNLKARTNQYVVRKADGRFYVFTEIQLKEQGEYEEVGARETPKAVSEGDFELTPKHTPHYVPRGQYPVGN